MPAERALAGADSLSALLDAAPPADPAILSPGGGRTLNYGELAAGVAAFAARLAGAGVSHGDTVAFALPNSPGHVQPLLAVTALGAAAAPLNPA